jgi:KRAB domain-containing zinc finger protein
LRKHSSVHSGEKSFECALCTKTFVHFYDLQRHLSVHTRVKPWRLSTLAETFESSHWWKTPYLLSASFTQSDKLKCHINSGVCSGSTDCKDDPVINSSFNPDTCSWN